MLQRLVTFSIILLFVVAGCGPKPAKQIQIFHGKTLDQAVSLLNKRSQEVPPMQIRGRCEWQHSSRSEKNKKEEFSVKIWINPPTQIRLQGDVAFNPKGLMLGCNESEFWLAIKPELDSFWWGRWDQQTNYDHLIISSLRLLEAIGIIQITDQTLWKFDNEKQFDVLALHRSDGSLEKRIYLSGNDYRIAKIEYFDSQGKLFISIELEKYKKVTESFFLPNMIKTTSHNSDGSTDSFKISISSANQQQFSDKRIFSMPNTAGYEKVYQIVDANVTEMQ